MNSAVRWSSSSGGYELASARFMIFSILDVAPAGGTIDEGGIYVGLGGFKVGFMEVCMQAA